MNITTTERPAEPGEVCSCGRQATVVYLIDLFGAVGWCGLGGVAPIVPCPWCGAGPHLIRCPEYNVRPAGAR